MTEKYQTREERRKHLEAQRAKNKGKKKGKKGSIIKRIFLALVALGIIGIIAGASTFAYMVKDTPKFDANALKAAIPSEIYAQNGEVVAEIGTQKLDYVEYNDIPDLVRNAIIATEDSRFFKHHGVDPIRLGAAVIANLRDGFGSEGASTITQQLVKLNFLTPEKTLTRKAQEAWLAIQLERKYSKEEIFELYVNKVFMSERTVGISTAAKVYFGKELSELNLAEAALIAGIPQSPNNYNPFNHPERAEKRRNIVLSLMHQHGYITEEEMKEAQAMPVEASLLPEEEREQYRDKIPYDSYIGQVIQEIEEKYPELNVFTDGLKIYTGLDVNAQDYIDEIMYEGKIVPFPDEKFQAAITLLDTKTGEVRAIGGNRDKNVSFGLNYATDFPRQPGSTIKPILDYGPAIEYLKWGTYQTIVDEPYKYSTGQTINNWDNRHMGAMSIREALARSRNVPALKAMKAAGLENARQFANRIGFELEEVYESYAIGALETTTLQMAGAYSAFGNNGYYTKPHTVKEIELRDGTKINMKPKTEAAMSDYTAFMITDMLKSVVNSGYGTGRIANIPGLPLAGKTGTTNYSSEELRKYGHPRGAVPDAWFAGYTTNYTAVVWTGYEYRKDALRTTRDQQIAMRIFKSVMQHVSKDIKTPDFTVPDSVTRVKVEKGTNKLAGPYTPEHLISYEWAVKGNAPSAVSERFTEMQGLSGLSAVYDASTKEIRLSWQYYNEEAENVQFLVMVAKDGGAEQTLTTTTEKGLRMPVYEPGSYTFKVIALIGGERSDTVSTTITVSAPSGDDGNTENGGNPEPPSDRDEEFPNEGNNNQGNGHHQPGSGNENNQNGNGNGNGHGQQNEDTVPNEGTENEPANGSGEAEEAGTTPHHNGDSEANAASEQAAEQ